LDTDPSDWLESVIELPVDDKVTFVEFLAQSGAAPLPEPPAFETAHSGDRGTIAVLDIIASGPTGWDIKPAQIKGISP
jgi:hypothetical protein